MDKQKQCGMCHARESESGPPLTQCRRCGKWFCAQSACAGMHAEIEKLERLIGGRFSFAERGNTTFEIVFSTSTIAPIRRAIPAPVAHAMRVLSVPEDANAEQVKAAFRGKVKAAATGDGGYSGDMDALVKAKEQVLNWLEQVR